MKFHHEFVFVSLNLLESNAPLLQCIYQLGQFSFQIIDFVLVLFCCCLQAQVKGFQAGDLIVLVLDLAVELFYLGIFIVVKLAYLGFVALLHLFICLELLLNFICLFVEEIYFFILSLKLLLGIGKVFFEVFYGVRLFSYFVLLPC